MLICGVTNSFSPFAVFEKGVTFTNKVGGVEYQGPTGPPSPRTWTAPKSGAYRITATGASGASAVAGLSGGCGARVGGVFNLQANDTLLVRVGQKGTATTYAAGGGGGSFVALNGNPLLVAGGGGGYSGGGGGRVGGGGGSWNTGTQPSAVEGACTPSGHGEVTIEFAHP